MRAEQTSYGDVPVSPTPGESAELVFAGIVRKFQDAERHERPDSEQADSRTEPQAHTPLKRPSPQVRLETDPQGNTLVRCRFCGETVSRAWDDGNKKIGPGFRYLERALANEGTYLARNGRASWWGSAGGSHKRHNCRLQTTQDFAE